MVGKSEASSQGQGQANNNKKEKRATTTTPTGNNITQLSHKKNKKAITRSVYCLV